MSHSPISDMPSLGIGTWQNTDPEECANAVATALEMGYRHVDTAQAYGNEEAVGAGLAAADVPREDVFLATKVWIDNLAYDDVLETAAESLDELGVDYVDLLYVHWPARAYDPEETLAAFGEAQTRGAQTLAITTGGRLAEMAAHVVEFAYASQPRAALGYSFTVLLGVLAQIGLLAGDSDAGMQEAIQVMRDLQPEIAAGVPLADNPAKQLARHLHARLPVIYGAGFLAAVANRWKTQVNENAKHWAFFEVLPELHHNAVVGLGIPAAIRDQALVVMLRSALDHARVQTRWQVTQDLLEREQVAYQVLWGRGESRLAQMFSLIHFGDYVSFYLAMLNQVDPTPVETIAFLKQRLAAAG